MVADVLRSRIVNGELADGDLLPKQDELLEEFPVSRPSIREAMRILETEGLISVRRGNVGGAEVHRPKPESAAYMLGLAMQSDRVTLEDLGRALRILEPICAGLGARRPDRAAAVVAELVELNARAKEVLDDGPAFTRLARQFHDHLVGSCGNRTVTMVVGTLETLWSQHEAEWADHTEAGGRYPERRLRELVLRSHAKIVDAIRSGNAEQAERLVAKHLEESQRFVLASTARQRISITGLRSHLGPSLDARTMVRRTR
jgi:DNA-binding FadR family transcriptional regulator